MNAKIIRTSGDSYNAAQTALLGTIINAIELPWGDPARNSGYSYKSTPGGGRDGAWYWRAQDLDFNVNTTYNPNFMPSRPPVIPTVTISQAKAKLLELADLEYKNFAYGKTGRYIKDTHRFTFRSRGKILLTAQINSLRTWIQVTEFTASCLGQSVQNFLAQNGMSTNLG